MAVDPATESLTDPSRLCVECGLCCNGALFTHAKLTPEEVDHAPGAVSTRGGEPSFSLPCPLLTGAGCSIYNDRYGICRSFRCALLKKVSDGEVGIAEGLDRVAEAKRLIGRLTAELPSGATIAGRLEIGAAAQSTNEAVNPRRSAQLRVFSIAADVFLDRHFRLSNKRFSEMQ